MAMRFSQISPLENVLAGRQLPDRRRSVAMAFMRGNYPIALM